MRAALCFLVLAHAAWGVSPVAVTRGCSVLHDPVASSAEVCRLRAGTAVDELERSAVPGFYFVRIGRCEGYLTNSCFGSSSADAPRRLPKSIEISPSHRWLLALSGSFDVSRAVVPYEASLTSGFGLYGLVQLHIPLGRFRLSPGVGYQAILLSHAINASGSLVDSNPAPFNQTLGYLTAQLLFSARLGELGSDFGASRSMVGDNAYWLEAGLEYLYPVSAYQRIRDLPAEAFSNSDRPLLALLGTSVDFQLTSWLLVAGRLQLFYNTTATQGSHYFGGRLAIALMSTL
jgi:hypothetical protein